MIKRTFTEEENRVFYGALPRKLCGAGVVITRTNVNGAIEVLIVKPTYKDGWLVPGGAVEKMESPRAAALREVGEEIGDCVAIGRLLSCDYEGPNNVRGDIMHFLFAATLKDGAVPVVASGEIQDVKWIAVQDCAQYLPAGLAAAVASAVAGLAVGRSDYMEEGKIVL